MPVPTSLGFCFTLIPLLAMDLGEFFGIPADFIRTVPETELSTPEDYIKSLDVTETTTTDISSEETEDIEKGVVEEDVVEEAVADEVVADEETPLLA